MLSLRRLAAARRLPLRPLAPHLARRSASGASGPAPPDGLDRYPHLDSPRGWLRALDWAGTAIFASSGAIAAAAAGLDLLGSVAVGSITAVGGGTIRDVLILRREPFWSGADGEVEYLYIAALAAAATFVAYPALSDSWPDDTAVDSISLGAFAVIGAMNGVRAALPAPLVVLCGVVTATGGGATRDVLTRRPVRILHSHKELYATAAGAGAVAYLAARSSGAPLALRIGAGIGATAGVRMMAVALGLRLPTWDAAHIK